MSPVRVCVCCWGPVLFLPSALVFKSCFSFKAMVPVFMCRPQGRPFERDVRLCKICTHVRLAVGVTLAVEVVGAGGSLVIVLDVTRHEVPVCVDHARIVFSREQPVQFLRGALFRISHELWG